MNLVGISGRLGRDLEASALANAGQSNARINFSIAVNDGYGENRKTMWIDCTVFGKHAETVANYGLVKGQEVVLKGRLTLRDTGYVKAQDGKEYSRPILGIVAEFVEPGRLSGEGRTNGNGNGSDSAPAVPAAAASASDEIPW